MSQRFDRPGDGRRPHSHSASRGRHARPESHGAPAPSAPRAAGFARGGESSDRGRAVPAREGSCPPANGRSRVWRVVFWAALVVFVCAMAALAALLFGYHQNREVYADLADRTFEAPDDARAMRLGDLTVDWDALYSINPDVIGWIYVPDSDINYPVVHSGDDVHYLKTNFYGETNWVVSFGTIFLSGANAPDFSDACNVVYGHHMNEGSMFSSIAQWTDDASFNAHRSVYLLTPAGNYRLESFALDHFDGDDAFIQTSFESDEARRAYVQDKIDRSVVACDSALPPASEITKLFMFSTCDNLPADGRYVLCCYVAESTVDAVAGLGSAGQAVDPLAAGEIGSAVAAS